MVMEVVPPAAPMVYAAASALKNIEKADALELRARLVVLLGPKNVSSLIVGRAEGSQFAAVRMSSLPGALDHE
jgi:hypothetical protein